MISTDSLGTYLRDAVALIVLCLCCHAMLTHCLVPFCRENAKKLCMKTQLLGIPVT